MSFNLNKWEQLTFAPWTERNLFYAVSANGYIYIAGGDTDLGRIADVWRSTNGIDWEFLTETPGWSARASHGFLYYDNKFWIFGGSPTSGSFFNDVWSSTDAITWTQVTASAPWGQRHEFGFCVHNNRMYVCGGYNGSSYYSDVYSSVDGLDWTLESSNYGALLRQHTLTSFLGDLWIHFGNNGSINYDDIRRSTDNGATWTHVGNAVSPRKNHKVVINSENDRLAIIAGQNQTATFNDVWTSSNGIDFVEITQLNSRESRGGFCIIKHSDAILTMGGFASPLLYNDIWYSVEPFLVSYNGNGNTVGVVPAAPIPYYTSDIVTVLDNVGGLEKDNAVFNNWNTSAGGSGIAYLPDDTFAMGVNNVILYAQWYARFAGGLIGNALPEVTDIYNNINYSGFSPYGSSPTNPTEFTLVETMILTYIEFPHVNNEGTPPGTVSFQHEDMTIYGPFQLYANYVWEFWQVDLSITQPMLPAGIYTVIDSNPECWSHNVQSDNRGMIRIEGGPATKEIYNSYWDTETSERVESDGGIGKTTNEMKIKGTLGVYQNWDFTDIWFMNDNE